VATIAPYAKASDAKVKLNEALTEHRHGRHPHKTAAAVEGLFDKQRGVALCTHRPALPTVFAQLGKHMGSRLRALLPDADPFLAPGEIVVCHVAHHSKHKVVAVERFRPFDD
jgi:8-oxo-dGTP diphosphatase